MRRKDIDRTSNADLIERIESEPNAVTRSVLKDVAVRRLADSDAELNRLRALNAELAEALRQLYDEQNGPPIAKRLDKWVAAMGAAQVALERAEKEQRP